MKKRVQISRELQTPYSFAPAAGRTLPRPAKAAVSFVLPTEPLFVGSYCRVPVRISAASGTTFDELEFRVSNPAGGFVSPSRDPLFNPQQPEIMLLVGTRPGTYQLAAFRTGTATALGVAPLRVTDVWRIEGEGPSLWFQGQVTGYSFGAAWGGGPAGPQNENVFPQSGTKRIAILLVDTASQRYTSDATALQAIKDRWLNEVINGVPFGGGTRSTREFYREASFNALNLSATVFGPVNLSDPIETYIQAGGAMAGSFPQSAVTAASGMINFDNFDNVLFVVRSRDAVGMTSRYGAWPYSSIGKWGPYNTNQGPKSLGITSMPHDWHEADGREIHATFAHEFGHTLGLSDQYTPTVAGLNMDDWELMDFERNLPYFSIAHRMMLGWLPASEIQTFNFSSSGVPADQTITLAPVELDPPPAGSSKGVEVRIADGRNYYFEYRVGEASEIGDRALPVNSRVLGTDVVSNPGSAPLARPVMLRLPKHASDNGAVLGNGDHYQEIDTTDGLEFRADVSGINGSKANLRIRYGANGRPDPSIRPWPAAPDRPWQSPDIEVRNARSIADPVNWFNVPWLNQDNTVVATVRNNGSLDAPGVEVDFYVKDYNLGGAPEFFLGSDTKDVPRGGAVEFTAHWVPPTTGHFCIVVRIPLYQTPGSPSIAEQTEFNNIAQSNYDHFNSATASPAHRTLTSVAIGNPFDQPTRVFLTAGQARAGFRTFLEHTWLWLDPGEVRQITAMFERAGHSLEEPPNGGDERPLPNNVGVVSFIEDPRVTPRHVINFHGALQARVATGRATRIVEFWVRENQSGGQVVAEDNGSPAGSGMVLIVVRRGKEPTYIRAELQNGLFRVDTLPRDWDEAQAHYLPAQGFVESESEVVHRP